MSLVFSSAAVSVNAETKLPETDAPAGAKAVDSSAASKCTKELINETAKASDSDKIPVMITFKNLDQAVLDAKIRENFSGKYGTLDEYNDYENVIVPRIIKEAEEEFGEILAHAHVYKDEETGEIIAKGYDAYVRSGSELQKMLESMSFEERNTHVHYGFSEEELEKVLEICEKGYSVVTSRMSVDIDEYRMAVINSEIDLWKKNVSECLTKYIAEDEIISNAVNMGMANLTKGQIEEISSDSMIASIGYAPPLMPVGDSDDDEGITLPEFTIGDINADGRTDVTDLSNLSLYLIGDTKFTEVQKKAADVDDDGEVKLTDLAKYRQYLSKIIDSLGPVQPVKTEGAAELLKQKYPEYFGLETGKGIEVYVWRGMAGKYSSVLMAGTNRNKEIEEITALPALTCEEAKLILNDYDVNKDSIFVIPIGYTKDKKLSFDAGKEYADTIKTYFDNDSLVSIEDLTVRDGMSTASALEKFYEDDEYTYSFGSIKSEYIECTFKDGSKLNIRTALEKGLVNISDLDIFGILYKKEEVKKPDLSNPLDKFFNDNDLQAYAEATVFETVEIDIDRDGTTEKCTLSRGTTSGLYTVIISAYSDGVLKYRNTINMDHYTHTTITETDGVLYLKRYNENPEEAKLNKLYIENNRITVDDLSEYEGYWGGPQYNTDITLVNIENTADRDGFGLDDAEEVFFKDEKYTYIFPAIQSKYVECTFSDGSKINIVDALEFGDVSVTDLKKFDILYYMEDADGNITSSLDKAMSRT